MSRTIGSSASERAFHASQSLFTFRHARLTVSLLTAPAKTAAGADGVPSGRRRLLYRGAQLETADGKRTPVSIRANQLSKR